jgi:hypothetical protein
MNKEERRKYFLAYYYAHKEAWLNRVKEYQHRPEVKAMINARRRKKRVVE